jgi:hypothetical protein
MSNDRSYLLNNDYASQGISEQLLKQMTVHFQGETAIN